MVGRCGRSLVVLIPLTVACGHETVLGGGSIDGSDEDVARDSLDGSVHDDRGSPPDAEDAPSEDAAAACPVWAVASGAGGDPDGTRDRPFGGLQAALDGRRDCESVILITDGGEIDFDAAVTIEVPDGAALLIEAEAGAEVAARLRVPAGGAGLHATGPGSLTLRHLAVIGPAAGDLRCLDATVGSLTLQDTEWTDCVSGADGGAVAVVARQVAIVSSTFRRNRARGRGGAVFVGGLSETARLEVDGCVFDGNEADEGGGLSISVPSVDTLVSASRFVENRAARSGSAIAGYLGGTIVGCRFDSNHGGFEGGAVAGNSAWHLADVRQNVFVANEASGIDAGGTECCEPAPALDLTSAYGLVRNNLFVRNRSTYVTIFGVAGPGAVRFRGGSPRVANNTFVDDFSGGAANAATIRAVNADIRNNIFVGGEGSSTVAADVSGAGTSGVAYAGLWLSPEPFVVGEGVIVSNLIETPPEFVSPETDDYRLRSESGCMDAGDPSIAFVDADGSRNDLGAFGGPHGAWTPLP